MLGWRRFLWIVFGASFGILALLGLFILLMNPYGNLPRLLFSEHAITDINQRFQYPALVRSGHFDSVVIGTSDARLLDPAALDKVFGGRFANLAMNAGLAWEQYRLADLFIRETPHPRTLLVALDHVWCAADASTTRTTFRGFPDWMYDDNRWNDLGYMLNDKAVEISGRRLATALGWQAPRFQAGYEVFTPPESAYDPVKVRHKLWGDGGPRPIDAVEPPYTPTAAERAAWQFPALNWLDETLSRFSGRAVLVFMPAHIVAQPIPGSLGAARENECKARVAAIARRHGASPVIDFRIRSEITANDNNYWDPLHYRLPIADRVVSDIALAVDGGDAPNGDWRYLEEPSVAAISSSH
jgi:hypothetical protein